MRPFTLAVETSPMLEQRPSGVGRYVQALTRELAQLAAAEPLRLEWLYRASRRSACERLPAGPQIHQRAAGSTPLRYLLGGLRRADALLCSYHNQLTRIPGVPLVVVVHDLHAIHGINFSAEDQRRRQRTLRSLQRCADRAARLIFISDHVRRDFLAHFRFDASRSEVIHHGVDPGFHPRGAAECAAFRTRYRLARPYLLFAGEPRPNKNLARMLEAYAASPAAASHDVVIVGNLRRSAHGQATLDQIQRLRLHERVQLLDYLPDAEMPLAYAAAGGLLFASLDEGFGLPILEGMASGIPVLTSTTTSCPEVAAGHAVLVDPISETDSGTGLERLLKVDAAALEAARRHAAGMTWAATAQRTLAVMRRAAGGGHSDAA